MNETIPLCDFRQPSILDDAPVEYSAQQFNDGNAPAEML